MNWATTYGIKSTESLLEMRKEVWLHRYLMVLFILFLTLLGLSAYANETGWGVLSYAESGALLVMIATDSDKHKFRKAILAIDTLYRKRFRE